MSYRHKASERAAPAAGANGGGVDATLGPSLRGNWDRDFWAAKILPFGKLMKV